ncbi:MAG: acetolactate synthase, large subunit, biosynthetic type [Spirochaeta sp. LUC14_002_19_P3]|nr:MAG: acetolactate synthase, large subunit, biosynthetic type [Spirochaeta sp. LUC14_002_19_P3]
MPANMKPAAEVLLDVLYENDVRHVFGIPGGNSIPIYDALTHHPLDLILTRHEQGAVHMADGYARSSGKPGVVCVTSGPGATNTLTGILTAMMDSIPILVITGQSVTANIGLDAFQEADVLGMSFSAVKHSYLITDPQDVSRVVKEALHIATTGRPGPVLIDIPKDVSSAMIDPSIERNLDLPGYKVPSEIDSESLKAAAELINSAHSPVILAGHGVVLSGAAQELQSIAEKMNIPVITTLLGKGCFPENHSLSLGFPGMHGTAYANKALCDSDLIIAIGARWDDRITGIPERFCINAKKIHFDIDPVEINKIIPVDAAVVGDAKQALSALLPLLKPADTSRWLKQIARWCRDFPLKYHKEGKLRAQHIIEALGEMAGEEAVVCTDVGQHQMWAAQYVKSYDGKNWLTSGGAGTMGFGLPAAIGAQLARPDARVCTIVGDGSFQMTLCELSTAAVQKLPIKILVVNNNYLGMVRQWQHLFYENRLTGVDLEGNPDFMKLAAAYGIKGFRVKRSSDVRKILKAALEWDKGPCLIEAVVEQHDNVFPMVPAGAALEEMIIEAPRNRQSRQQRRTS